MTRTQLARILRKRVPIINWLANYSIDDALGDFCAGTTVGLTLMPQAIAYASLAGLDPQYGLYSAFAGSLLYITFGTCKEINIGPTALLSLLTFSYSRGNAETSSLLCLVSGCVIMISGMLQLGFLVDFVSAPVVGGFTSAASLIIIFSQIKGLLGLSFQSENFMDSCIKLSQQFRMTKIPDLILSLICIASLLILRKIKDTKTNNKKVDKLIWFLGTSRNAIIVIITATYSFILTKNSTVPFELTGHVEPGLPSFKIPPIPNFANGTTDFSEFFNSFGLGIIVIPFVSIIENVAIIKTFSQGKSLDATQEIMTLGFCNLIGSFFQSMPVCGSLSRSAVNNASEVRTPFGGFYTSILVILAMTLLTPYFSYIPKATLSSVITCAMIFMLEINMVKSIWRSNKRDLIPALTTFFLCLLIGVELGILTGILMDLAFLTYSYARPTIQFVYKNTESSSYIIVRPTTGLMYPVIEHLKHQIMKHSKKYEKTEHVILDCELINKIDFTALQGIASTMEILMNMKKKLIIMNAEPHIQKEIELFSKNPISFIKSINDLETNHFPNDEDIEINVTRV